MGRGVPVFKVTVEDAVSTVVNYIYYITTLISRSRMCSE